MARKEKSPPGLKLDGRRLWDSVVADYELEQHERDLLLQACQTLDAITELQSAVSARGAADSIRELAEARQQRLVYARLIAALRLPSGLDEQQRPQRRAIRGVYGSAGA